MEFVNKITLEDNLEYIIVDEINTETGKYIYLLNEEDIGKMCIRKTKIINNEESLVGLDNEREFQYALDLYIKKHR